MKKLIDRLTPAILKPAAVGYHLHVSKTYAVRIQREDLTPLRVLKLRLCGLR